MTKVQMWVHLALAVLWAIMIPVALYTGWIESIVFVAAISIYANFAGHMAAFESARAECLSEDRESPDE